MFLYAYPGFSLRSNPGLTLANAFGVRDDANSLASKVIDLAWTQSVPPAVAGGSVIRIQKSLAISHVRSAPHPLPQVVLTVSNSDIRLSRQSHAEISLG